MRRRTLLQLVPAYAALSLVGGCSGEPSTGPVAVKWDRDACERCRMVLSDRRHAAQIRFTGPDGRSRVVKFDDLGCAMVWLQDKPWRGAAGTEFWVNDHRDGRWIDARQAYYVSGHSTPMEYGIGAQDAPLAGALRYAEAESRVLAIEARYNRHGADVRAHAHEARQPGATPAAPVHSE